MKKKIEKKLYLGIDTSAYTTSIAVVNEDEELVLDRRVPLEVSGGTLGLRQQEAVYQHINHVSALWADFPGFDPHSVLEAVAVAKTPRPVKDSYMPVFKVGEALGLFLSKAAGLKYFASSHQEGHLMAGIWSAGLKPGRYLAVHFSGGTTEILSMEECCPGYLKIDYLGGTTDLNAGQFVDRLGLRLGLGFPAGPELELLAQKAGQKILELPVAVKGGMISFSGPASQAERIFEEGADGASLARATEICLAASLLKALENIIAASKESFQGILAVGGVMANKFIASYLQESYKKLPFYFAPGRFSSDNAAGLAVIACRQDRQ